MSRSHIMPRFILLLRPSVSTSRFPRSLEGCHSLKRGFRQIYQVVRPKFGTPPAHARTHPHHPLDDSISRELHGPRTQPLGSAPYTSSHTVLVPTHTLSPLTTHNTQPPRAKTSKTWLAGRDPYIYDASSLLKNKCKEDKTAERKFQDLLVSPSLTFPWKWLYACVREIHALLLFP